MGIRTGKQYLESLRDGRQMWIDGELVADVTRDRRFAAAAYTMAELYDMQHDPGLVESMTYSSPSNGERVGLSFLQPKSVDDLVRRRGMVKTWMDATCGMFGRSPDFMNITLTGFASEADAKPVRVMFMKSGLRPNIPHVASIKVFTISPRRTRSSTDFG